MKFKKIFDLPHISSYYQIFLSWKCRDKDLRFSLKYIHKTQMSGLSCPKSCGENPRQMLLLSFYLILNSQLFSPSPRIKKNRQKSALFLCFLFSQTHTLQNDNPRSLLTANRNQAWWNNSLKRTTLHLWIKRR